ncbi:MAG TPA: trypsin-like peptidase domain-containing protein [Geodermatophilus sp.]|nr:trypsin-like peptidase domain-containing protein [Geodermatophilus sp.]
MSVPTVESSPAAEPVPPSSGRSRRGGVRAALIGVTAVAVVAAGGGAGYVAGHEAASAGSASATPGVAATPDGAMDVPAVLARVEPAVVSVHTDLVGLSDTGQPVAERGTGTGFVVKSDGLIATNAHVVAGADDITVTLSDGRTLPARVVGQNPSADLAVLQVPAEHLPVAPLGDSAHLKVGDPVVAIGDALALPGGPTVTEGIVSALDRTIQTNDGATLDDVLQTDAAINPGNSGGPLVDATGHVVGIDTAAAGDGQNIGFAISIDGARSTIDSLLATTGAGIQNR